MTDEQWDTMNENIKNTNFLFRGIASIRYIEDRLQPRVLDVEINITNPSVIMSNDPAAMTVRYRPRELPRVIEGVEELLIRLKEINNHLNGE